MTKNKTTKQQNNKNNKNKQKQKFSSKFQNSVSILPPFFLTTLIFTYHDCTPTSARFRPLHQFICDEGKQHQTTTKTTTTTKKLGRIEICCHFIDKDGEKKKGESFGFIFLLFLLFLFLFLWIFVVLFCFCLVLLFRFLPVSFFLYISFIFHLYCDG